MFAMYLVGIVTAIAGGLGVEADHSENRNVFVYVGTAYVQTSLV